MGLWAQAETRNSEVLAYLNAENLSYEIVYHDTSDEQKVALAQGAVDVISSVSLSPIANSRIVAQFAPRPYYFDSTKGNTDLICRTPFTRPISAWSTMPLSSATARRAF